MLHLLGIGPKPLPAQLKLKLPPVNAFVDVSMTGGGPRGAVCVEAIGERTLEIGALPGTQSGATGVFSYSNGVGRFRFSSKCVALKGANAIFALPERVETLQVFSGVTQRNAVRIQTTISAQWRHAPGGRGNGGYVRCSLTDISRSGASLMVERDVQKGTTVEVEFGLPGVRAPLTVVAEVVRSFEVDSTKKIALGVRFQGVRPEDDRAIVEFINKRQAERRNRGLA